jgi:hypothetical protein
MKRILQSIRLDIFPQFLDNSLDPKLDNRSTVDTPVSEVPSHPQRQPTEETTIAAH